MKYSYEYSANDYKTPPELYNRALNRFEIPEFDLDVCCSEKNIPAKEHFIKGKKDGLAENWKQFNWCNPPFNECKLWVRKAWLEWQKYGNQTAMLIPVRTETVYWHNYILFDDNVQIDWLKKGYKFLDKDNNSMGVFKNALAIVYFGG